MLIITLIAEMYTLIHMNFKNALISIGVFF